MGHSNMKDRDLKGDTLSTVGVDICDLVLQRAGREVIFRTWDFGGQVNKGKRVCGGGIYKILLIFKSVEILIYFCCDYLNRHQMSLSKSDIPHQCYLIHVFF